MLISDYCDFCLGIVAAIRNLDSNQDNLVSNPDMEWRLDCFVWPIVSFAFSISFIRFSTIRIRVVFRFVPVRFMVKKDVKHCRGVKRGECQNCNFHDFGIRNGIIFQDFGIRNGINFRKLHFRICFFGKLVKVGYIFWKNW